MFSTNLKQILDTIKDGNLNQDVLEFLTNLEVNVTETGEIIIELNNVTEDIENHINTYIHENGINLLVEKEVDLDEMLYFLANNEDFIREVKISDLSVRERIHFLDSSYTEIDIKQFYFEAKN